MGRKGRQIVKREGRRGANKEGGLEERGMLGSKRKGQNICRRRRRKNYEKRG